MRRCQPAGPTVSLRGWGRPPCTRPAGGGGYVDADLYQAVPSSRAAGPARTVICGQNDNLMVHAVMAEVQRGEVIVLTMPEPRPVALVGDLLATQAQAAGAAAILVDASIRDVEELAEMGLPIWARWVRVKGALKEAAGAINVARDRRWRDDQSRRCAGAGCRRRRRGTAGPRDRDRSRHHCAREEKERVKRAKLQDRREVIRPRRPAHRRREQRR